MKQPSVRDTSVQSVDRALSLIEALAEDDRGCRLTDLSVRTGLPTSTVHRLLTTLEKRRFVQCERNGGIWRVGAQAFLVGASFVQRRSLIKLATPFLRKLRDQTRETANLAIIDDGGIIVVARLVSHHGTRFLTKVGGHVPRVTSGLGKAVLAACSNDDVKDVVGSRDIPQFGRSLTRTDQLFLQLETIRRRGYAIDDEEAQLGLRCVSSVISGAYGEPIAAISVSGVTERMSDERLPAVGAIVREVAEQLTIANAGALSPT